MTYLFWAFAAVWVGIFLYLYVLIRRSQALAWEVEMLREQLRKDALPTPSPAVGSRGVRS
jgi:CcmD family protein